MAFLATDAPTRPDLGTVVNRLVKLAIVVFRSLINVDLLLNSCTEFVRGCRNPSI